MTVSERFATLISNIKLTDKQCEDGSAAHKGVRDCLNNHYYGYSSESANSLLFGSWGKNTEIRPPRDVDVLFCLPDSVYNRFLWKTGNVQSQLLQEVKAVLAKKYGNTLMRADGQVVLVAFSNYNVEVVPAFASGTQYKICDTNNGGRYVVTDPVAEIRNVRESNTATVGNTRDLIRMLKCWQGYCTVPVKSFWLELLAIDFLSNWEYKGKSTVYYDWMARDFFKYMISKASGYVIVPGTYETIWLGDSWKSKTESAYGRAQKACEYESDNLPYTAGGEWQKIFGSYIPLG